MADAGRFLVGVGTAMTITLPGGLADPVDVDRAMAELAAVECDDRLPAANSALRAVLAFGAFPFDRSAPAALVIPATLYCREPDGTEWATVLDGPDETPVQLRARLVAIAAAVAAAVSAIRRGELTKVVLARRIDVTLDQAPDLAALLRRWRSLEPSGTLFSLPTSHGQFVGASPELLESAKDTEEHRLVVDAIREALAPCCEELTIPDRPELVHLHNLTHLGTVIDGRLRTDSLQPIPSALHLVALLHPTPAVGGVPRSVALDLIARALRGGNPGHDRGRPDRHPDRRRRRGVRFASRDRTRRSRIEIHGGVRRTSSRYAVQYLRVRRQGDAALPQYWSVVPVASDDSGKLVGAVPGHEVPGSRNLHQFCSSHETGQGPAGVGSHHKIPRPNHHCSGHADPRQCGMHISNFVDQGPLLGHEGASMPAEGTPLTTENGLVGQGGQESIPMVQGNPRRQTPHLR
jgi:hypothetical protein